MALIIAEIEISSSVAKVKCWDAAHLNTASQSSPLRKHKICETNGNLLPAGASGLKVRFTFLNEAWRNLAKTAVFRNKHITMDAVIVDRTLPHKKIGQAGCGLYRNAPGKGGKPHIALNQQHSAALLGHCVGNVNCGGTFAFVL